MVRVTKTGAIAVGSRFLHSSRTHS